MQESQVWSLGQEDPLEKKMAAYYIFLPGESHGQRSLEGYSPLGSKRVGHDLATQQQQQQQQTYVTWSLGPAAWAQLASPSTPLSRSTKTFKKLSIGLHLAFKPWVSTLLQFFLWF